MNIFQKMYAPIRKGNEYRHEKYGAPLSLSEDWVKTQEKRKAMKALRPDPITMTCEEKEAFKAGFGKWDEWTGARFSRRDNPNPTEETDLGAICEGHPVYGWRAKP